MAAAVICFSILFIKPDKEFLFSNVRGDCSGRADFMYNALYRSKNNPKVVFFGSSKTMNGINDSLLNALAGENNYLNLGYCRYGRNLDLYLIEQYIQTHSPEVVVLEVRTYENDNMHPISAFLLPVSAICEGFRFLDIDACSHLYNKWLSHVKYIRSQVFSLLYAVPAINANSGYWKINNTENERELKRRYTAENHSAEKLNPNSSFYLSRLAKHCKEKHIRLCYLYLPPFGNKSVVPDSFDYYRSTGEVLLPPDSIVKRPAYFANYEHFNSSGANAVTRWILSTQAL